MLTLRDSIVNGYYLSLGLKGLHPALKNSLAIQAILFVESLTGRGP